MTRTKRIIIGAAGATAVLGALAVGAVAQADDQEPAAPSYVTVEGDGRAGVIEREAQPQDDGRDCPDKGGEGGEGAAPQSPPAGEL